MITFLLIALILFCCYGLSVRPWQTDYLSLNKTTSIKGIFTVLVFLSHAISYSAQPLANDIGARILSFLGQMIVVLFFFYSGFGIMEQYGRRGESYLKSFFKNRVLKLLIHFDLAVLLFFIVQLILGNQYAISDYIFRWIGWTSIGNSNWFIFDILVLYLFIYFALYTLEKYSTSKSFAIIILYLLTFLLWLFLHYMKLGLTWWYNTIIAFPLGATYSMIHPKIDSFHENKPLGFSFIVIISFFSWITFRNYLGNDSYGFSAILFALSVIGISSFITFDNYILRWLGNNCFTIYILQRIPMIILSHFELNKTFPLFIICSLFFTLLLVFVYNLTTSYLDTRLFPRKT